MKSYFNNTFIVLSLILFFQSVDAAVISAEEKQKKKDLAQLKREVSKVKEKDLVEDLRQFIYKSRPNRLPGYKGHEEGKKFIQESILKYSPQNPARLQLFKPQFELTHTHYQNEFQEKIAKHYQAQTPEYKNWSKFLLHLKDVEKHYNSISGSNIIWEKKGKDHQKLLIIGVHYDSVSFDAKKFQFNLKAEAPAPGADDNGSGVILALKLIEILATKDLKTDVQVIFFDFQEYFALGSHAYVEELRAQARLPQVYGFVNLLMLGHDTKKNDKEKKNFNYSIYLKQKDSTPEFAQFLGDFQRLGKTFSTQMRFLESDYDLGPSDAVPFGKAGIPNLVLSQNHEIDLNPRQHGADDFVETLNQKTYYESYKFIIGALSSYLLEL